MMFNSLAIFIQGALMTMAIAICALAIGITVGLVFGIFTCNKLKLKVVSPMLNAYVLFFRGTPLYVQVLIVYFALPEFTGINLSPFIAGVIALGLNSIAYVAEIVRCGINSVPEGQWEACYVLCYSKTAMLKSIILPQMLRNVLPALSNEMIALLEATSILSMIGVVELTKVATNVSARTLDPLAVYSVVALFYLGMTSAISVLMKYLEKRISI